MADKSYNLSMAIGETDDPNAIIETFIADAAITKGDPVYLSVDDQVTPAAAAQDCIGIAMKTVARQLPTLLVGVERLLDFPVPGLRAGSVPAYTQQDFCSI